MNSIDALLKRLEASQGDTQAQAALTAGFMLLNQPEAQRETLRAALDAAAVLRWFDAGLIAKVLGITDDDASLCFETLKSLPFIEVYRSGDNELYNVHESTRLGWRKQLAQEHGQCFRVLSLSAATCFAGDHTAAGRIEWLYQLLIGDPEKGATELENLNRAWSSSAHPENYYALASALKELEETRLVTGRALCWILVVISWARNMRGETARLKNDENQILNLARKFNDSAAEAKAQCLLGKINKCQGKLDAAQTAYDEYLAIYRRLAVLEPGNTGWQRELALAYSYVGETLRDQGKLDAAQAAYDEYLAICRRFAELDPGNTGWQRDLAVAYSYQGGVLRELGKLDAGQAAYDKYLAISRRLAELDPGNAGWQRGLAVAYSCQGGVLRDQGKLDAAQAAYDEYLAICRRLAELDPGNTGWQRDLAVALKNAGAVFHDQSRLDDAHKVFKESLAILQRLTKLEPANVIWQQDLSAVRSWLE